MRRIKLTVAYDGSAYCGWQVQPNGLSVQAVLEQALAELLGTPTGVTGASRTDAGVHARGNVAVFDTDARMPADKFAFALNTYLPPDVRIQGSEEVGAAFHPQRADTEKTYEYKILNRIFPDPMLRHDALFWHGKLDIPAMREAAGQYVGTHDFVSFAAAGGATERALHSTYETPEKNGTVRTIYASELVAEPLDERFARDGARDGAPAGAAPDVSAPDLRRGVLLRFRITGNGFLYNMVRIMAGTLLEVGKGEKRAADIPRIFDARDRAAAGATAPAHGLTLIGIHYKSNQEEEGNKT